jgi:hypothetical protein
VSASRLFRQHVLSLLTFLDFGDPAAVPERDVLTLELDGDRVLHLVLLSEDAWMLLVELPFAADPEHCLRLNQPDGEAAQAIIGLGADGRSLLWLRLPLTGCGETEAREALQSLLRQSAELLASGAEAIADARAAGALA